MALISMNSPKNKIDKDKIREEKQEKLKLLQQQFLNKNKEVTKNNIKNTIAVNKPTTFNNVKKNIDKDTKNQLNIANKKLEELREKEKKYKDTTFKLKNNVTTLEEQLKSEKNNNEILSNKLNKYLTKNNELEKEIENLKEQYEKFKQSYTIKAFNIITRDIYNRDEKIIKLQKHIQKLDNAIKKYKEQIFDLNHGEEITIRDKKYYNQIITSYAQANAKLNQRILKLEETYKEKVSQLANSDLVLSQLKDNVQIAKTIKGSRYNRKYLFGTLKTINSFVFFKNIYGELIPANIDRITFKENIPCKAVLYYNRDNKVVTVQKTYDDKELFIKEFKNSKVYKKKQKRKEFLYENVNYENNYNVLIIGAENKDEYKSTLSRIGLNVVYYNSYEGNIVRLRNMLDRYDVIICCVKHSRHYASNLMTYMQEHDAENSFKYNIIEKDNLENIVGRVRYCIENM